MRRMEHLVELLGRAELGHGQRGQRVVDLDGLGRLTPCCGLAAHQVKCVAVPGQVCGDGGSCGDRPFERPQRAGALVPARARVHEDDGATPGRSILLAHHQLGPMGCGRPVDAAQVIAVAVVADGHIVLAVQGDHVGDGALRADTVPAGSPTTEDLDAGQHQNVGGAGQRCGDGGQAERVPHAQRQRPDPVATADVGADLVVHLADLAGFHRWQDKAWSVAEQVIHTFLGKLQQGAPSRGVLEDDLDAGGLVDDEPGRVNGASDHDTVAPAPGGQAGQQRQCGQEHSDAGDIGEPEQEAADQQGQAGGHEGTAACGEYVSDAGHCPGP